MKKIYKVTILATILMLFINNVVYANNVIIYSDNDLSTINSGEEFNVKIKFVADEDSVALQGKLLFDENKFEIVCDDAYPENAKTINGADVVLGMAAVNGNFIINTLNGKNDGNELELIFKVKENVELKDDKIVLADVKSNLDFGNVNSCIIVREQAKSQLYIVVIFICGIFSFIFIIFIIIRTNGKKRKGE